MKKSLVLCIIFLLCLTFGVTTVLAQHKMITLNAFVNNQPIVDQYSVLHSMTRGVRGEYWEHHGPVYEPVLITEGDNRVIRTNDRSLLRGLVGSEVRVTGWLDEHNGAIIHIDHVDVIERGDKPHNNYQGERWRNLDWQ